MNDEADVDIKRERERGVFEFCVKEKQKINK